MLSCLHLKLPIAQFSAEVKQSVIQGDVDCSRGSRYHQALLSVPLTGFGVHDDLLLSTANT